MFFEADWKMARSSSQSHSSTQSGHIIHGPSWKCTQQQRLNTNTAQRVAAKTLRTVSLRTNLRSECPGFEQNTGSGPLTAPTRHLLAEPSRSHSDLRLHSEPTDHLEDMCDNLRGVTLRRAQKTCHDHLLRGTFKDPNFFQPSLTTKRE